MCTNMFNAQCYQITFSLSLLCYQALKVLFLQSIKGDIFYLKSA